MSTEKNRKNALRWFDTAASDLDTAKILISNGKFAHSCFHAHQAAEKAIKSVWYFVGEDPLGHSIQKMIDDLQYCSLEVYEKLKVILKEGKLLDRYYIPTRYPNGLPDITPDMAYDEDDANACIEKADKILRVVGEYYE